MLANHNVIQASDEIPNWFQVIFFVGSCLTIVLQIVAISYSIYHSRIQLIKPNHNTTKYVKDLVFRDTIVFFTITQFLAIGSLILYTSNGNNFGPAINKTYINFGIGSLNIVLTSYLSVILFFMTLSIRQTQQVQQLLLKGAENGTTILGVTLENYKYTRKYISETIYSSESASLSIILIAALNIAVYIVCIYSIFTEANKQLPSALMFKASDIIAYSGVFMKEILFFVYILYMSCSINDIHDEFITILCNAVWDEESQDRKRMGLILYAMNSPICFKVLGFRARKFKVLNCLLAFLSLSVFYIGAKMYFFYQEL